MPTLLLIDASSYLYRAFHALPDLRTATGYPTGALRGMVSMLRNCVQQYGADYVACVFDAKGKTFRDDWYPDYKANRPPMPDDLRLQLDAVHEVVALLGLPILMEEGVEADDVIGTLSVRATQAGIRTLISTGDKDMAQLVNAQVGLVNTMTNEQLDPQGVEAKFGIPPALIVDYLTLIGDTVDNVPGVAKVGPKTAVKWLQQYGSLDAIVQSAGAVTGVVGQNLRDALDWLPQGKRLITIKTDVDLAITWDDLRPKPIETTALKDFYQRYEFKSWLRDFADAPITTPVAAPKGQAAFDFDSPVDSPTSLDASRLQYPCILSQADLAQWLDKLRDSSLTALDTETTSLDPLNAKLVGISFATAAGDAAYLPLAHAYAGVPEQLPFDNTLALLKPWLENPACAKVGQNITYDQHVFANHGIALAGVAHDTMLQSYVLSSHQRHNMDDLAAKYLQRKTITYEEVAGKGAKQIGFDQVDVSIATQYAAEDADITLQLHHTLFAQLQADPALLKLYSEIEMPVRQVIWQIERNGVLIDKQKLYQHSSQLGAQLQSLEQQAYLLAGQPFNLNSPKQLQSILFDTLGIPTKGVRKTPSGGYSTDEEVLQQLAADHPLPKLLLEYRTLAKLKSTYTDKLPQMINPSTGRVHTHYGQAVAVTGRLSSSDPNLQNIPIRSAEGRKIREAFMAPAGSVIVSADYSQIELRIMAHLSQDTGLLNAFAANEDIHRATAAEVFGAPLADVTQEQRRYAKSINFGLIYGMSAFGLASQLEIDRTQAQNYIDRYFARYPGVAHYMQDTREQARVQGYVSTVFGRRLWLPEINASNQMRRQGAERAAINAPMQGTAADLIKLAMLAVQDWLQQQQFQSRLTMQVHDELVLEVPQDELDAVKMQLPLLMQQVADLRVPLLAEVGIGQNWDEAH